MLRFRFRRPTQHSLQTNVWSAWFPPERPAEKQSGISGALQFGFLMLGVFLLLPVRSSNCGVSSFFTKQALMNLSPTMSIEEYGPPSTVHLTELSFTANSWSQHFFLILPSGS